LSTYIDNITGVRTLWNLP